MVVMLLVAISSSFPGTAKKKVRAYKKKMSVRKVAQKMIPICYFMVWLSRKVKQGKLERESREMKGLTNKVPRSFTDQ